MVSLDECGDDYRRKSGKTIVKARTATAKDGRQFIFVVEFDNFGGCTNLNVYLISRVM